MELELILPTCLSLFGVSIHQAVKAPGISIPKWNITPSDQMFIGVRSRVWWMHLGKLWPYMTPPAKVRWSVWKLLAWTLFSALKSELQEVVKARMGAFVTRPTPLCFRPIADTVCDLGGICVPICSRNPVFCIAHLQTWIDQAGSSVSLMAQMVWQGSTGKVAKVAAHWG